MINEIIKPRSPITRIPNADIFDIAKNSFFVGFLRIFHTLMHFSINSLISMFFEESYYF